jgi:hypothetical protein
MMQGLEGLTGKRVELLKDALPAATRIGLMFNRDNPSTVKSLAQAEQVASRLGLVIRPFPAQPTDEIEAAVAALSREAVDGVDIEPVLPFTSHPRETGEFLLKYRGSRRFGTPSNRRERRASFLRSEPLRRDAAPGLFRRPHPERNQTRRPPGGASEQARTGRQHEGRGSSGAQGSWLSHPRLREQTGRM